MHPTIIGLHLVKHVFQAHGVNAAGAVVLLKKLRLPELIASSNKLNLLCRRHRSTRKGSLLGRELTASGHQVKLMPAAHVKPHVKRGKNGELNAEAVCKAVNRPTILCADQERRATIDPDVTSHPRPARATASMLVNSLLRQLAKFGLVAPIRSLASSGAQNSLARESELLEPARARVELILMKIDDLQSKIEAIERTSHGLSLRLASIPGVGIIKATTLVANAGAFKSGRQFAAWIGAATEREWWQDGNGRVLQKRRIIFAAVARPQRDHSNAPRA
jgi:transposase